MANLRSPALAFHEEARRGFRFRRAAISLFWIAASALLLLAPLIPTNSVAQEFVGILWTNFASHLMLASWVAFGFSIWARARNHIRTLTLGWITATFAALSLFQILWFSSEVSRAGGSVKPFSALALASYDNAPPDAVRTYQVQEGQALRAAVWRPRSKISLAPILFDIHGGAWAGGAPTADGTSLRWFADRGWLVISVEYRLARPDMPTWNKAPLDVACGLVWAAANAKRFGGDPRRIAVSGRSAGGNLAINLAYSAALGEARSGCGGEVPIPAAVVAFSPVVDPMNAFKNGQEFPGADPRSFIPLYIGGPPSRFPDRLRAIASATYLSARAPATLLIQPIHDRLIPSEGVFRFGQQARSVGVDMSVVQLPMINHYLWYANSLADQAILTITADYLSRRGLGPQ